MMRRTASTAAVFVVAAGALTGCSSDKPKQAAPTCPPGNPSPSRTVAWSSIYANVYNASDRSGEGATVAKQLGWRGMHTLDVKNDPLSDDRPTPKFAEIRYGKNGRTIALNVARQIPHANLYQDERSDPTIDIIIGNKFSLAPRPPRAVKNVSVTVLNTTFMPGLAADVAGRLGKQGFHADAEANDKAYYPDDSAVIVYDEEGLPDAQRLQMSIPGSRLLQDTQTKGAVDIKGSAVRLYLGSKWPTNGKVVPLSQATASPSPSPSASGGC